jgi:hypothetical protein
MYDFKKGDRVKVFNGGKLEGWATVKKLLNNDDNYYVVLFDGDDPGALYQRWVMPAWQEDGFDPQQAKDFSLSHYGTPRASGKD